MRSVRHGTGASLPPCDEQVLALKIVTPGMGTIDVTPEDPDGGKLFRMCRVGLGACGVAVEATMRCVPKHLLREHTSVLTRAEAVAKHAECVSFDARAETTFDAT
jgi:L-galactono-1,4-lactone dehydrogenase